MNKQLKFGVVLSYVSMAIQGLSMLVYTPFLLRYLGKSEYGTYELAISVASYLSLLSLGFGSSYNRFFFRMKKEDASGKEVKKLNGMFLLLFLLIAAISLVAGMGLVKGTPIFFGKGLTAAEIHNTQILLTVMVVNIAVTFPSSVFESYILANEHYIFQRGITVLQAILNPFLGLMLLVMGMRSVALVLATTVLTIGKLVIYIYHSMGKLQMRFEFRHLNLKIFKEIGIFSLYIFLNIVTDQINWAVDKTLLAALVSSSAVAVYAVASQVNQSYLYLSTSVAAVFSPRINKMEAEKKGDLSDLFYKVGRIQFMILSYILFGFFLLGRYFIAVWAGADYKNAYYVVLFLIVPVTIPLVQNIGIEIQKAKNMHKFRSIVYALIAVGNVLISIPLIRLYGEVGAAMGTAFGILLGNGLAMNWYYHTKIGIDMIKFWKELLKLMPCAIIAFALSLGARAAFGLDTIWKFLLLGVIYSLIYFILLWKIGMNTFEKSLLGGVRNAKNHS